MATNKYLRPKDAAAKLGMGLSTIYWKVENDASFPRPVKFSEKTTVFIESELDAWADARVAESRKATA
ncbi:AlpA family phage regulatory protein [Caballeronia sp. GAWG1-1]|uniref:helix-turn-helix transcriptional regulator n=1 Tax=Caballeronia sp. GAWG1-1 TaxID=2921742 RepID=UPI00202870B4|nr:AlpA family phage regulatory protein [Caballeronia sp. GAWG1-1]